MLNFQVWVWGVWVWLLARPFYETSTDFKLLLDNWTLQLAGCCNKFYGFDWIFVFSPKLSAQDCSKANLWLLNSVWRSCNQGDIQLEFQVTSSYFALSAPRPSYQIDRRQNFLFCIFYFLFLLRLGRCSPTNWDLKVELGISKLASYRFISGIGIFSSGGLTVELPALVFSSGGLTYGLGVCSAARWIGFEVSSHSSRSQDSALLTPPHRSSSLTFHSQIWFLT